VRVGEGFGRNDFGGIVGRRALVATRELAWEHGDGQPHEESSEHGEGENAGDRLARDQGQRPPSGAHAGGQRPKAPPRRRNPPPHGSDALSREEEEVGDRIAGAAQALAQRT
jgi:hypothetical protein